MSGLPIVADRQGYYGDPTGELVDAESMATFSSMQLE